MKTVWRLSLALMLLLTGCTEATQGRSAEELVPSMPEAYTMYDDEDRARLMDRFALAGTAATMDLAFGAKVELMDEYVQCLEDVGALALRGYQNQTYPEVFGILTVINQQRLTSGRNLTGCLLQSATAFIQDEPEIRPCYATMRHTEDGIDGETTYYIMFAGTSPAYCETMCSALNSNNISCTSWQD